MRSKKPIIIFLFLSLFLTPVLVSADTGLASGVVPLPVFIIISVIGLISAATGMITGSSLLGTFGFLIIFIGGFIIQGGDLGISTTTNITEVASSTIVTKIYDGWDGANHHLIGWGVMVVSMVMWALVMMRGDDDY